MKNLLLILALLFPTLAVAQTSRNPCYTTQGQSGTMPNCIGVGTATPLPVTLPSGAGGAVAIDQTTPGTTNGVIAKGGASFATSQVTVAATSTPTVAARAGRIAVTITNASAVDIFCQTGTATLTTGDLIVGTKGAAKTYQTAAAIACISASGSNVVTIAESY